MVLNRGKSGVKEKSSLRSPVDEIPISSRLRHSSPSRTRSASNVSPSRTKTKSPTRTRSPARTKSPSRRTPNVAKKGIVQPLQSSTPKQASSPKARSPIRRSPARKSPTRVTKQSTRLTESYFSIFPQKPRENVIEFDSGSDSDPDLQVIEKPKAAVRGRARTSTDNVEVQNTGITTSKHVSSTTNVVKRTTRASQNRDIERVVHLKHFDNVARKLGEFSDEDDSILFARKSQSVDRGGDFKTISEFGGTFGALFLTFFIPFSVLALFATCNEYQCSFTKMPDLAKYKYLSTYFHLSSFLGYIAYSTLLALLSVLPFGGKKVSGLLTKHGKFDYVMNGMFSCFLIFSILVGLEVNGIPITDFIAEHLQHIAIVSICLGFFISIYAYVRSFYVQFSSLNIHVLDKSAIYAFFMGREMNPRVFNLLDLKIYMFRMAIIGNLVLQFVHVYRSLGWSNVPQSNFDFSHINPTLIVLVVLQSVYWFDILLFESAIVTTFDFLYEGFGFMYIIGCLVYPFLGTANVKYVIDYEIQLPVWKLLLAILIFVFGYILYRGSNSQKDAFRKNPYDPALANLETIPTTKGKKLLCSGFWGIVRHPNYLGDILIQASFASFSLLVPAVLMPVSSIVFLIHRTTRDHARCKQKYGAAWDRYCNKVKYILVPKIY